MQHMQDAPLPFAGATVLEINRNESPLCIRLAASFAAKLVAELGAKVVKLEPAEGDPTRRLPPLIGGAGPERSGQQSAVYEFLNTSKTVVRQVGVHDAWLETLMGRSISAVIAEEGDPALGLAQACGIPTVEIAGWPETWTGERPPLSEFTVLALGGMLDMIGDPEREPLRIAGHQASYGAGLAAFTALSAMLTAREAGGPTEPARVSLVENMLWVNWKAVAGAQATGASPSRKGARAEFQVLRCRDGWVALVYTVTQFDAVVRMVGEPRLSDPRFVSREGRIANGPELYRLLAPWFAARTRGEIYELAQNVNVPLGPVYDAAELLNDPQYLAREFVTAMPHPKLGSLRMLRLPVLWNGGVYHPMPPVEMTLENVLSALDACATVRDSGAAGARMPLEGVRVIDFGQLTAGANTSAMLADLGADVIKVESAESMDLFRYMGAADRQPGWWNRSAQFRFTNRNKRGVSINLKMETGRRLIRALINQSDVVVENFRRGVIERLGIDYASISSTNPRIILASISSQGETGPNRAHASFGSTLDATAGMSAMTGYADDDKPCVTGTDVNYPDQVVSLFATGMIIAAVREARRTGRGALLDMSQREIASFLLGEEFVAAGADPARSPSRRRGNAEEGIWLQDCFRGSDGRWVAVTLVDEQDALRACRLIDALATPEQVRQRLVDWCARRAAEAAAHELGAAGVAAAPAFDGIALLNNPGLLGQTVVIGDDGVLVKGMPYTFGGRPFKASRAAPELGQHTAEVLRDMLRLEPVAIERLDTLGVTCADPGKGANL